MKVTLQLSKLVFIPMLLTLLTLVAWKVIWLRLYHPFPRIYWLCRMIALLESLIRDKVGCSNHNWLSQRWSELMTRQGCYEITSDEYAKLVWSNGLTRAFPPSPIWSFWECSSVLVVSLVHTLSGTLPLAFERPSQEDRTIESLGVPCRKFFNCCWRTRADRVCSIFQRWKQGVYYLDDFLTTKTRTDAAAKVKGLLQAPLTWQNMLIALGHCMDWLGGTNW